MSKGRLFRYKKNIENLEKEMNTMSEFLTINSIKKKMKEDMKVKIFVCGLVIVATLSMIFIYSFNDFRSGPILFNIMFLLFPLAISVFVIVLYAFIMKGVIRKYHKFMKYPIVDSIKELKITKEDGIIRITKTGTRIATNGEGGDVLYASKLDYWKTLDGQFFIFDICENEELYLKTEGPDFRVFSRCIPFNEEDKPNVKLIMM